jgi:23S rRNA (guanosine2251-2'-O)-methyltransferase
VAVIEGRQPVREALRAGRSIRRILLADGVQMKGALAEIVSLARENGVRIERVPRASLDERAGSHAHQGVMAEADEIVSRSWRDAVVAARAKGETPLLIALDGITDPQNLGAIFRSAEVLGAHAALVPKRRTALIGPAAVKASAGAVEHLVIDQVSNLERALAACHDEGLWIVALAGEGDQDIDACDLLAEPVVLVVGSEGTGVSALIRKRAHVQVRIPTLGNIESLNASAAAAVALWECARRRLVRKY